ncbi:Uma2 family endonuclease [Azospirillum sp. RWY-5-1]|uniref:Uma2 family endonuclease n=1 Tax=Azospirillum oleiclasticum TaxID=2735135 RepID=A0ABX2T304_9PROT|nr:Uma2 family endonuclease [Azospirillum oleiclasticum]NYZ11525.1 Uma2 family endonuclease [Azospirillum oleiclasticum]NYZ18686.1 Uma2 family endonuclease [Azospirillum oleiclasticum]
MGKALRKPWTVAEFVAWEERQVERYEFVDGIVRMMTGGTAAHSTIITNLVVALRSAMRNGPCRPLVDTPKVVTAFASLYPDVAIVCQPVEPDRTTLDEPTVIIEVLSPSTEGEDRGGKWAAYQTLPSLAHYLLVVQNEARVELFTRDGAGWRFQVFTGLNAVVELSTVGAALPLAEIYDGALG